MKIIGKSDDGYICTITDSEIAHIMGKDKVPPKTIIIGGIISIAAAWNRLKMLMRSQEAITEVKGVLQALSTSLDTVEPLYEEINAGMERSIELDEPEDKKPHKKAS